MERKNGGADPAALKEAEKAFTKGEKALKTGLFKWSADFTEGAMYFEKAAKQFKQLGEKQRALDAYLRWSACCEQMNENYGAAEGLVEAAYFEKNKQKSLEYLHRAQNFYKINGNANRGQQTLKQYANKLLEQEGNEEAQRFALDIYQSLFDEVFEGDNYAWNPDIVNQYLQILMQKQEYKRAIEAKQTFIKHMKQQGMIDHQIRRAYIEILCIQIVSEDTRPDRIEATIQKFQEDVGGAVYSSDEYNMAMQMKEALEAKDWAKLQALSKKPIFSFLETEIVRCFKKVIMNPPQEGPVVGVSSTVPGGEKAKQKALDNIML